MAAVTARSLTEKRLGARVNAVLSDTTSVTTSSTTLVKADPSRVVLVIVNLGAYNIYINPVGAATTTSGIYVAKQGGSVTFTEKDDYDTVSSYDVQGLADGGSSACYILEYKLQNDPAEVA